MAQIRQLAAIMFTDIVGYTALMGKDEQKAFDFLSKNRLIQKPIIEEFNGRWIKELGDGVMASFITVSDAVNAAIKIQEACTAAKEFQLRIGIHLGEVVFEFDDVFGDGVNIASRIQSIANPGSIFISESINNNVANKKDIKTIFVKEEILKNVKDAVRIYEVIFGKDENENTIITTIQPATKITHEKSIAVLPFVNMSNDPEQEYFSDGMAEEIINSLSHLKELRVAGRTSSFHFKGKNIDLRIIGEKLNVKTILEGSIRKQGNKLRITAQLVNVENGFHLWSEKYDRDMNDIFAIQDEIALAITEKLKITLLDDERAVIHKNPTENKEAYDLYLKGRYYYNRRGAGIKKGLEYFQQAAEKDPAFVLAYSGMADAFAILGFYGILPPDIAMPKAKQFAEKAIQLDDSHAEAVTTLAFINVFYDWNWAEAKKKFQLAFELNPDYAPAHYWYSYYLSFVEGKFDEGVKFARNAAEHLEPLVSISHHVLSIALVNAGKYEEALQAAKMAIELDANSFVGYRALGISLVALKRYEEAIEALKTSVTLSSRNAWVMGELSCAYSLSGQIDESHKIMDEMLLRSKTEFIPGLSLATTAYSINDYDKTFEFLELAVDQHDGSLIGIKSWPMSSFVRTTPRFYPLFKRINFPD